MKQCPHCNSEILDDSIFCDRCGKRLLVCADCGVFVRGKFCRNCGSKNIIDALEYEQRQKAAPEPEIYFIPDEQTLEKHTATLTSADGNIVLHIDDTTEYIIGRKSPQFGKELAGCSRMSRTHAMIRWDVNEDCWEVTDLGSAHGTFVNDNKLSPNEPYSFISGSLLDFAGYEFELVEDDDPSKRYFTSSSSSSQTVQVDSSAEKMLEKGIQYQDKECYEKAFQCFQKAAAQGSARAMGGLGAYYYYGYYVQENESKAYKWAKKGADLNDAFSECLLGKLYYEENSIKDDLAEAFRLFKLSAEQGNYEAMKYLGVMYRDGEGVDVDKAKAITWLKKAIKEGYDNAYFSLGNVYDEDDDSGYFNPHEALRWYNKGANAGDSDCMVNIGLLYDDDGAFGVDYDEAIKWYRKAVKEENERGYYNLALKYYYGDGVEEDEEKCFELMHQAVELGYSDAEEWLEENKK